MKKILLIGFYIVIIVACKKNENGELANRFIVAGQKDSINCTLYNNDTTKSLLPDFSQECKISKDSVDFDNDNVYDLLLINTSGSVMAQNLNEMWVRNNYVDAQVNVLNYRNFAISGPFSYMETIDRKADWRYEISTANCSDIIGCRSMDWMNIDNKYQSYKFLGLRFIYASDTIYGWARISPTIVVFDYAINKK